METTSRGRPRIQDAADDIVAAVLATAGARVSTPDFSTRRIAEVTGLSQTLVSRACRRIRRVGAGRGEAESGEGPTDGRVEDSGDGGLTLAEVHVRFPQIVLRFEPAGAGQAGRSRSHRTAPPQKTVFERRAAALMASLHASEASRWRVREVGEPGEAREVGDAPSAPMARPSPNGLTACWNPKEPSWDDFLDQTAELLSRCAPTADAIPGDLLDLLARRAGGGLHGTDWQRQAQKTAHTSDSDSEGIRPTGELERSPRNRWFSQVELSVTEQIAIALRKEIINSGFRAGDRLSPNVFGDHLGLSRSAVRAAMRRLVDDGLLDFSEGSFRVPAVTGADVVDLYAARLHLGMVLLRGCAAQPRHQMLPVRLALGAVEAAATQGTRSDVGLADLQFQQELAEASGLSQSARGFHALTLRVRMFIAVLRLDYSPAVERIVSDDRRILTAVLAGDAEAAVRAWRLKLDNAVRHMSALAPESFDAELWSRLSR